MHKMMWWLVAGLFLAACGIANRPVAAPETEESTDSPFTVTEVVLTATATATNAPTMTAVPPAVTTTPVPMTVLQEIVPEEPLPGSNIEVLATELDRPVAFTFAPDGRLFFTEKESGQVRVMVEGVLRPEPVLTVPVGPSAEQGLLGITLDPDFSDNHHVWIYHTLPGAANDGVKVNRVLRFTEQDNVALQVTAVYTSANSSGDGTHNGGNLAFDPAGYLYLSLGEDNQPGLAQRLDDPRGKVLRFRPTVPLSAAADNPFHDGDGPNEDSIYAYGLRNPFDFVIDPLSDDGRIFAIDNGPSCDDEVNLILPGYNYGWHDRYDCDDAGDLDPARNTIAPLLYWTPTTAPAGITVYTGDDFPEWYGDLFFCSYLDARLHRLQLNAARDQIISHSAINGMNCQTDVFNGPDGALYFVEGGGFAPGTLKRLFR